MNLELFNVKWNDEKLKMLFEQLPVEPGIYYNYILNYKKIIEYMINRDVHYCFLDMLYKKLYPQNIDKKDKKSYVTFLKIIENGEKEHFWGTFKFNKHLVLYFKNNTYLCYLDKKRSSITPSRITSQMLVKSSLRLAINYNLYLASSKKLESFYENDKNYSDLYYFNNKKRDFLVLFTSSDTIFTSHKRRVALEEYVGRFYNNLKENQQMILYVVSPYPIQESVINYFNKTQIVIRNKVSNIIDTHFNGLPIS